MAPVFGITAPDHHATLSKPQFGAKCNTEML